MNEYMQIAKIGKCVGLKGDLKLHLLCDFAEQFCVGASFSTLPNKNDRLCISYYNHDQGLVRFKGYENREKAQELVNFILISSIEETRANCHLNEEEFFWFDIIGCQIYENDLLLGSVEDIQRLAIDDYLCIKTAENLLEQKLSKTFMLPYIQRYILSVDIKSKKIHVKDALEILKAS